MTHIKARTITGRFASPLYDMPSGDWADALDELARAGHQITWTHGTIADDPAVTGGYMLIDGQRAGGRTPRPTSVSAIGPALPAVPARLV